MWLGVPCSGGMLWLGIPWLYPSLAYSVAWLGMACCAMAWRIIQCRACAITWCTMQWHVCDEACCAMAWRTMYCYGCGVALGIVPWLGLGYCRLLHGGSILSQSSSFLLFSYDITYSYSFPFIQIILCSLLQLKSMVATTITSSRRDHAFGIGSY